MAAPAPDDPITSTPHLHTGAASTPAQVNRREPSSMTRQDGIADPEAVPEERSFRIIEYAMAAIALLAAGILAFVR